MVLFIIKIIIALVIICLLRFMIWRESKTNPFHYYIRLRFGSRAASTLNYSALSLIGGGVGIIIFSLPDKSFGLIIGGLLGTIGAFIAM